MIGAITVTVRATTSTLRGGSRIPRNNAGRVGLSTRGTIPAETPVPATLDLRGIRRPGADMSAVDPGAEAQLPFDAPPGDPR
ncbi:hypothetical protein CTI14_07530, partial [Methylobacterium radiotolerans]